MTTLYALTVEHNVAKAKLVAVQARIAAKSTSKLLTVEEELDLQFAKADWLATYNAMRGAQPVGTP